MRFLEHTVSCRKRGASIIWNRVAIGEIPDSRKLVADLGLRTISQRDSIPNGFVTLAYLEHFRMMRSMRARDGERTQVELLCMVCEIVGECCHNCPFKWLNS